MSVFPLKPTSSYVKKYFAALALFQTQGHTTEGNTRSAFSDLLKRCCAPYDWHLVEEYPFKGTAKQSLRADGALVDTLTLVHSLWEAKDSADDLQKEIKAKVAKGYPLTNILFQSPTRAVLYQDSHIKLDCDLTDPENLVEVLQLFFDHRQAHEVDWEEAVFKFSEKIPDLAQGVTTILTDEHKKNADFRQKFQSFADLCRQSINPDLTDPAIQKMLVQHLLTERIFRKVFNNQEFLSRNVIAAEIEKVIHSITAKHFSRDTFLKPLDRFYTAIEKAAEQQEGYTEKQHFLNAVYEKFFQSFDRKQADTHGIVYTPQPIVDFMVRSVEEILKSEFGKSLSDEGVHILDPFTGTGNFITRIMQQIKTSRLPQKYANELHCNEVMLLPYYIASMNIEHAYSEAVGSYRPFKGICLVDTFELTETRKGSNFEMFTAANTSRVQKQQAAPITVVVGNPPYNVGQKKEDDDNKKRKYKDLDMRVAKTYSADSAAQSVSKLDEAYVKSFRWASDRIGDQGIVAFVSNNSYIEKMIFDGVRRHLAKDFDRLYVINLHGDIRRDSMRDGIPLGEKHTVFGLSAMVGVSIGFFVKHPTASKSLNYAEVPFRSTRTEKFEWLSRYGKISLIPWKSLTPDSKYTWLTEGLEEGFDALLPLSGKTDEGIFSTHSLGVSTNRDPWAYNFNQEELTSNIERSIAFYNSEVDRWDGSGRKGLVGSFIRKDGQQISWSRDLKLDLGRGKRVVFSQLKIRSSLYRPYVKSNLFMDRVFNEEVYQFPKFFPSSQAEKENKVICIGGYGRKPFSVLASSNLANLNLYGDPQQSFPFYTYDEDRANPRENITDWAFERHLTHYADQTITKWDIFHSTYALLHHPEYRTRYAANLKRELPRIPFPPDLHAFAAAGKRLMELHIDYEKQPEYPLEEIEHPGKPWTLRVEKMSLSKDKTDLRYNEALTLRGIPPAAFDYRLGNRSALEWVIDQYRVSTDPRSGIVNDPNQEDDPTYILRLIKQVITVSLETQTIIAALPSLNLAPHETETAAATN